MAVFLRANLRGCQAVITRPSNFNSSVTIRRFATFSHEGGSLGKSSTYGRNNSRFYVNRAITPIKAGTSSNYGSTGIVLLVLSVLGIIAYQTAEAQSDSVVGPVVEHFFYNAKVDTTRKAIEKILKQVDTTSKSIMREGFSELSMQQTEFFNNIRLQLQNFEEMHGRLLDRTVDTIGEEVSSQLAQIDTMVHEWTDISSKPNLSRTISQIQGLASNFILFSDIPKVIAFSPTFVSPYHKNSYITIECIGAFPPISSPEMVPKLFLQNNTYPLTQNVGGVLRFYVPFSDAFPDGSSSSCNYTVQIPHIERGWIWNSSKEYSYRGSITLLPDSPGKIILESAHIETIFDTKEISSCTPHKQTSRRKGFNRTEKNHPYVLNTEPGWHIEKSEFIVHENKGRRSTSSWTLGQQTPDQVTWLVSTHKYEPVKHCDKIIFSIKATIKRAIQKPITKEREIDIEWGNSMFIGFAGEKPMITYKAFDGTTEVLVPNTFGKYVDVYIKDGRTFLSAKSPEKISYFNFQKLEVHNQEQRV